MTDREAGTAEAEALGQVICREIRRPVTGSPDRTAGEEEATRGTG